MTQVSFPAGVVKLHGVMHPARTRNATAPVVAVCHPHPRYGGSMQNNVVGAVCEMLAAAGIHALRFNFRSVGRSTGTYGEGIAEEADVRGALDYLIGLEDVDAARMGLCGYSFGGMIAAAVALNDSRVGALALISPAMDAAALKMLSGFKRRLLVIGGALDDQVTSDFLSGNLSTVPLIVPSADHFWWGQEAALTTVLADFFQNVL